MLHGHKGLYIGNIDGKITSIIYFLFLTLFASKLS